MSKGVKILVAVLATLLVLVLVAFGLWSWFTRQAFPQTRGEMTVTGLQADVEIIRDEYGVAHIYAQNAADLFFAEGFVHAQERFWQMEFQRRVAAGRMAEIFGETALGTDVFLRHFNFHEKAQQDYEMLPAELQDIVEAYGAGVNAYISQRSPAELGLEFALLGLQGVTVDVEPWTPADTLSWAYMMIFDQGGFRSGPADLINADLLNTVGPELYADLRPLYRDDRPVIISTEELVEMGLPTAGGDLPAAIAQWPFLAKEYGHQKQTAVLAETQAEAMLADWGFGFSGGSNSFAVSGERTASGMPVLANDPHMSVNAPSLFYQLGLHCQEKTAECPFEFRGFSLPGTPGILIGHNDRIAWGLTNASFDAEDIFIEKINPENPDQYEVNGEWVDMAIRDEAIVVRGRDEPETFQVRHTRNGIVASDAMMDPAEYNLGDDLPDPMAVVYAWTALEPVRSIQAVIEANRAQNWDEFNEALQYFDAGKQNWIYADVEGNIGLVMPGKVPIRAGGDGTLPVPGWTDAYIWTGYIPYEALPRTLNPEKGFIVSANNPQVEADDYPYLINVFHDRGQRAELVTMQLGESPTGVTVEQAMAIHTGNKSISAQEIIPYLETLSFEDGALSAARDSLLAWDTDMLMDSPESALFNIFWVELLAATFHDQLPERHHPRGDHPTSDTMYFLLQEPDSVWWDDIETSEIEDRDAILKRSFAAAYDEGLAKLGDDLDQWRWGDLHTITFRNATLGNSGISLIEGIFNRGPYATSGSESVPQKTCWSANSDNFEVICIPHLRQVVDLGDLSNSWMINQLGQSGHPMHPEYDHFVDKWRFFEYVPNNWLREDAESGDSELLILKTP